MSALRRYLPPLASGILFGAGLTVGGIAAIGAFELGTVQKAEAISRPQPGVPIELRKSVCTHCAVGCTVTAEVQNGVWTGQEPSWDSPINRGSHCAKGASVRELVHSERRLKYPLKLVDGQWTRVTWEEAIDEIRRRWQAIIAREGAEALLPFSYAGTMGHVQYFAGEPFATTGASEGR